MTSGSDWFQDPTVLTMEVKPRLEPQGVVPQIPGYDDLREVARGGQGVVYRGLQRSTRRCVAIKVLGDREMPSPASRRRFEREIDLVAGLKHPSIVSVYDSGVTGDGRLYLVMEYIEGVPLDEAVRGSGGQNAPAMSVDRTLELFAGVCDALQYAHQHGVIHRDLKPSNIRVDGVGLPHVLDFGLAKAADTATGNPTGAPAHSVLSMSGQFLGSLPWASPEQASGDSDSVDTRSDVYSLGVILYQLLTGRFPYDVASGLRSTLDNILGAVPEAPSRFRGEVNDEVSTILARCLAKEPARRYQSAGDLARDLRHYLAGEAIEAKRDSAWYTVRKQLRRHRMAAGAGVAFVLLVFAALIVSLWLYHDASKQRDAARLQSARAMATNDFLLGTLGAVIPDKDGRDVKVLDLVDRAAATVDGQYAGQDDLRASMHATLRNVYQKLGQEEKAIEQGKASLDIVRASKGENDPEALSEAGDFGLVLHDAGRDAEAEKVLRPVLEAQRRVIGPYADNTLATVISLGQTLKAQSRAADAEALYREVMEGARPLRGDDDVGVLGIQAALATATDDLGKLDEAERLYRDNLDRRRRVLGATHSQTRATITNLVVLLIKRGRLAEAEPLAREQFRIAQEKDGPEHPTTLTAMHNLSKLLQDEGKMDEAEAMMRRTLEMRLRVLGEDHPHTLATMSNLSMLLLTRGHDAEAEPLARRALDVRIRTQGATHMDTMISMNNLANALQKMGKIDEAEAYFRRVVTTTDTSLPPGHWINAVFRSNHANCLIVMKRYQEAEDLLLPVIDRLKGALGDSHAHTIKARKNLVKLYEEWGRPEKAAEAKRALEQAAPPGASASK